MLPGPLPLPPRYSTHDWTPLAFGDFDEVWADVKSPGDGRTYSVGTASVNTNDPQAGALFSNEPIDLPPNPYPGQPNIWAFNNPTFTRQVVVLQASDENYAQNQGIRWQRYFNGNQAGGVLHANARGISVWPEANPTDTRIAICGETSSFLVPHSQDVNGNGATSTGGHGFIAVYDGNGDLKWSYLFFGNGVNVDACAITDVSIRVEDVGGSLEDVVTYCGVSSYGNPPIPSNNRSLTIKLPFAVPACPNAAGGVADNGTAQWDGIVGRLRNSHASPTMLSFPVLSPSNNPAGDPQSTATQDFHSIVGGAHQDGLFGIDEIDANTFVVVGSTALTPSSTPGLGPFTFPFTTTCVPLPQVASYALGTALVFDASQIAGPANALILLSSSPLGTVPVVSGLHTVARDVLVRRDWSVPSSLALIVGSTDDPGLVGGWMQNGPQTVHGGGEDGFVLGALVQPSVPLLGPNFGTSVEVAGRD